MAALDVEERGPAGVGDVRGVDRAAGQPPQEEAVDGAAGELAALGALTRSGDMVEDPGDLGRGEIGIEQQPGRRPDQRLGALALSCAHSSAVRRSCQTIARWIGSPVARSQTTIVSRWLVMPIAGDAVGARLLPSTSRATASVSSQISSGSCSTHPRAG